MRSMIFFVIAACLISITVAIYRGSTTCRPGDDGTYVGGMLVAGCPADH